MDRRRQTPRLLTGAALVGACFACIAIAADSPLRAARWLPKDRQAHALSREPTECLTLVADTQTARLIAIGRAAFRTPRLLGGQAARAGLACNSCHRNGRGNPDLQFPGLSGAAGTADVTSSLMSSHRGDGVVNPVPIPDLSGPMAALKVSRDPANPALRRFIHGLIVEEFDGPEPTDRSLDGLVAYVRSLSPDACPATSEHALTVATYLADARTAAQAAQFALDEHDPATARLMLASARSALGLIDERYTAPRLQRDRESLRAADLELAAIEQAIDTGRTDTSLRIAAWLAGLPRWSQGLQRDESASLFDPAQLAASVAP